MKRDGRRMEKKSASSRRTSKRKRRTREPSVDVQVEGERGKMHTDGFGLLAFRVQDGELELGAHFALVARDEKQVEAQMLLALLVHACTRHTQHTLNSEQ